MKVDSIIGGLANAGRDAAEREAAGYDGLWSAETAHDPFLPLVLAAEHTERAELATGIAVAFARNPMVLAHAAHELNDFAGGRLLLGIGSQVRPHIERRFSERWSEPVSRMREYIAALRAIWRSWNCGEPLHFDGTHYRHTFMTPAFDPGPSAYGTPRVVLGALGVFYFLQVVRLGQVQRDLASDPAGASRHDRRAATQARRVDGRLRLRLGDDLVEKRLHRLAGGLPRSGYLPAESTS